MVFRGHTQVHSRGLLALGPTASLIFRVFNIAPLRNRRFIYLFNVIDWHTQFSFLIVEHILFLVSVRMHVCFLLQFRERSQKQGLQGFPHQRRMILKETEGSFSTGSSY